jgi:hypothetical protein
MKKNAMKEKSKPKAFEVSKKSEPKEKVLTAEGYRRALMKRMKGVK